MTTAPFANLSVLVVEDEKFTRMVLAKLVGTLGVKAVHQAEDGGTALQAVRTHRPDLVLCDVEMKPLDGLDFLRALRAEGEAALRSLPVLFMTNRADEERVTQARELGADTFLVKPVTPDALRDALARLIG